MAFYDIDGEKKNIIGVGKIIIDTNAVTWNVPHLHFLVSQNDTYFEAVCLEFGLVSSGTSQEEAAKRLVEQTVYYIGTVINRGRGFEELKEVALNDFMHRYWGAYRHIEFCLAETKQDLSHEIESRITLALQKLFNDKVKEIITSMANAKADEIVKEYEKLSIFKISSVSYRPLEAAA